MTTEAPATQQRLAGPRWLVGGRWRRRAELVAVTAALAPVWLVLVVAFVLWLAAGVLPVVGFVVFVVLAVVCWPPLRVWLRWSWWRARWYYDARAAGLSVEAEPSVFARTDGPLDRRMIVVPRVRIALTESGRRYRCRALAGQVLGDYEQAADRLALRWAAASVTVEHTLGERHVTIVVATEVPPVREWRA